MEVPKLIIKYLRTTGDIRSYSLIWIFLTIISLVQKTLMARILSGDTVSDRYRMLLATLIIVHPLLRFVVFGPIQKKIIRNTTEEMWKAHLIEYNTLTLASKYPFSTKDLETKMNEFKYSITYWLESGFPIIIQSIPTIYLMIYVFVKAGLFTILVILVLSGCVAYFVIKLRLEQKMLDAHNKCKINKEILREKLNLNLPKFQFQSRSVADIMTLIKASNQNEFEFEKVRSDQQCFNSVLSEIFLVVILLSVTDNLVGLMSATTMFTTIMTTLFQLSNNSLKYEADLASIREKFNAEKCVKLPFVLFDHDIEVRTCRIKKGSFELKMTDEFVLNPGNKILIQGPSGGGKTTLLNALFGLEPGICLSENLPGNYFRNVVWMYQEIKENFRVENLTLRQVFDDETDDWKIEQCIRIAKCGDWVDRMWTKHTNRTVSDAINTPKPKSYFNIQIDRIFKFVGKYLKIDKMRTDITIDIPEPKSYLDIKIGKISGGEKTRLAIAMLLHELDKPLKLPTSSDELNHTKPPILVLDEPEQGSDPPVAYAMIKSIMERFPDTTIIVISHLERIRTEFNWDDQICVNDGLIYRA